ncbi:MAG: hypothetical protein MJ246_06530 [Clostridia bacterium]|nr:hypothetical protein [Clostridia bacterium]
MDYIGVFIVLLFIIIMYIIYILNIFKRNDYYEVVYKRLMEIASRASLKNRECAFDILNYTNNCRLDKVAISEYKRGITKKIAYYQKRDKLDDKVATQILDSVYK